MAEDEGLTVAQMSAADAEWMRFLLRLRETGMPIAQIREYAALREQGPISTEPRLRLLEAHQAVLQEQIARLRAHETSLAVKIATYREDLATLRAHREDGPDDDRDDDRDDH